LFVALAVLGAAFSPLQPPLQLQLEEPGLRQLAPRTSQFVDVGRPQGQSQQQLEIISTDGFPVPLRSRCWMVAGGYGVSAMMASMGGVLLDAFSRGNSRNGNQHDTTPSAVAMGIGALVGLVPGILLGNESRREEQSLARGVVTLLDVGGTLALGFTTNLVFNQRSGSVF
jgi:hypothetical protein